MNLSAPVIDVEFKHFHLYCGSGGGAKGFNKNSGKARVGNLRGRWRCIGDVDRPCPQSRDFRRGYTMTVRVKVVANNAEISAVISRLTSGEWMRAQQSALARVRADPTLGSAYAEIDGVLYYSAESEGGQRMRERIAAGEVEAAP